MLLFVYWNVMSFVFVCMFVRPCVRIWVCHAVRQEQTFCTLSVNHHLESIFLVCAYQELWPLDWQIKWLSGTTTSSLNSLDYLLKLKIYAVFKGNNKDKKVKCEWIFPGWKRNTLVRGKFLTQKLSKFNSGVKVIFVILPLFMQSCRSSTPV